jgi:hypothetical protein
MVRFFLFCVDTYTQARGEVITYVILNSVAGEGKLMSENVGGIGCGVGHHHGGFTSTSAILVLYILLVIILSACFI